jgi:hypothetical protein
LTIEKTVSVANRVLWLVPGLTQVSLAGTIIIVPPVLEEPKQVLCGAVGSRVIDHIADIELAKNVLFQPTPADCRLKCPNGEKTLLFLMGRFPRLPITGEWPHDNRLFTPQFPFNGVTVRPTQYLERQFYKLLLEFSYFASWRDELERLAVKQ